MLITISADGTLRTLYTEAIDLDTIGRAALRRASLVEPTEDGRWTADLSPVDGPTLGPFDRRSEALAAEVEWIESSHL